MPRAYLSFNLPEDKEDFETASKAINYKLALFEIQQEIFRPARKHGYSDEHLHNLVEKNKDAVEIIGILEQKFYQILNENGAEDAT